MFNKRNPRSTQAGFTSFLAIHLRCKTSSDCQKTNLMHININPEVKKISAKSMKTKKKNQLLTLLSIEDV